MANLNELLNINSVENWGEIIDHGGDNMHRIPRQSGAFVLFSAYNRARRGHPETPLRRAFWSYMANERSPNAGLTIPMGLSRNDFINQLMIDFNSLVNPGFVGKRKSRKAKSLKSKSRKAKSLKRKSRKAKSLKRKSRKAKSLKRKSLKRKSRKAKSLKRKSLKRKSRARK
jgi:hypothetical protein